VGKHQSVKKIDLSGAKLAGHDRFNGYYMEDVGTEGVGNMGVKSPSDDVALLAASLHFLKQDVVRVSAVIRVRIAGARSCPLSYSDLEWIILLRNICRGLSG
jgi:hypothetical protein